MLRTIGSFVLVGLTAAATGCQYRGVSKPNVQMGILPAEVSNEELQAMLTRTVHPTWPLDLAVAKLAHADPYHDYSENSRGPHLDLPQSDEAVLWRNLEGAKDDRGRPLIDKVTFVGPMLTSDKPTIDNLRQAAARLRSRALLVYAIQENSELGYNNGALLYWTFIGLWVVPGNMVGYYSAAQALLIDTVSGQIITVVNSDAKHEEAVTAAALDIAKDRAQHEAHTAALEQLYSNVQKELARIAE